MSKMGQYVMELQEAVTDAVFQATSMSMTEAMVVAFVKNRIPEASENDILTEYRRVVNGFMSD